MRAIIIEESLHIDSIPPALDGLTRLRTYRHLLTDTEPITITELDVPDTDGLHVAMILAQALKPTRYYAHLVGADVLLIIYPHTVVRVERGDEPALAVARQIGATFDIPDDQMRYAEMFDIDHPDAAHRNAG